MGVTKFPYGIGVGKAAPFDLSNITEIVFKAPIALATNSFILNATGTQLPNNGSITYSRSQIGTAPANGANTTWTLDIPRNMTINVTHASSVVAMTCLITGRDVYGETMSELLTITAGGTSKSAAGKKAFKYVDSITFTSSGNATTNTANVGHADVFGFPVPLVKNTVLKELVGNNPAAAGTVVLADTSTATSTTGDVRGTYAPALAADGSRTWTIICIPSSLVSLGVPQA